MTGAELIDGGGQKKNPGGDFVSGPITNIAGYRFVDLDDRDNLQSVFRSLCADLELKGTIFLRRKASIFLAGPATNWMVSRVFSRTMNGSRASR